MTDREGATHEPPLPRPCDVPWAEEVWIDLLDQVLNVGGVSCGARARFDSSERRVGAGIPGYPIYTMVTCQRKRDHEGPHLARGRRSLLYHGYYAWQWGPDAPSAKPH